MGLEEFEKELADERQREKDQKRRQRDERHRAHKHKDRDHHDGSRGENEGHRRKRRRHGEEEKPRTSKTHRQTEDDCRMGKTNKRDAWMEAPSAIAVDYVQPKTVPVPERTAPKTQDLQIYDNDLNREYLLAAQNGATDMPAECPATYTIGDAGSNWRMTKLKGVLRRAAEENKDVEELALEQYGDLRNFDEAREEQLELERYSTYGKGYQMPEKPTGRLFEERQSKIPVVDPSPRDEKAPSAPQSSTDLNKLKAALMKAKLRDDANIEVLQTQYSAALDASSSNQDVVLGAMHDRMLAGKRGEVNAVTNRRGRERGLVEENADMSIEDMVREERRTKGQAGGESRRFAERIAKDGKFGNDLEYMDENADRLAKRMHRSEINLKNTAVAEFQKINRILDACPLCHHEESNEAPVAPVVSLATRTFLTLPTEPELSEYGAIIVPIQHRQNLLECDDDEWEEVRNFMKSLTRLYHDQGRDIIFYENAAAPQRRQHAALQAVPLPKDVGGLAPAFFKEAILTAEEEWSQHRKLIDTAAKAHAGWGKAAFRKSLVKEMPYFHVWFELDGGLGHIVEDGSRWPKGDLFAREIVGGMLDADAEIINRQGRWTRAFDPRLERFRQRWRPFDWTRVLAE